MKQVVFEAGGLLRGSSAPALQTFLSRHKGIRKAEANTYSQTVTIEYNENEITAEEIRKLIDQCGYHCLGEVVPDHVCPHGQGFSP
jgi:Cu2+-exporting ATPase